MCIRDRYRASRMWCDVGVLISKYACQSIYKHHGPNELKLSTKTVVRLRMNRLIWTLGGGFRYLLSQLLRQTERQLAQSPRYRCRLLYSMCCVALATVVRSYIYAVSYTHLRAHETDSYLVCRLLLEKKKYAVFCLKKKNSFFFFFFLMIRRQPRSTHCISSAASDVYKRQALLHSPALEVR